MAGSGINTYEFPYIRPEKLGWYEGMKKEIWDPQKRTVLGRTGKSWGGVSLFYLVYFAILFAMFAICMKALLMAMDDKQPRYLLDDSLIGSNPGLGYRPMPQDSASAMIWYRAANESDYRRWTDELDKFLEPYRISQKLPGGGKNQQICDFDRPPKEGNVCAVDVKEFYPCTMEMGYSFNRSSPCIFIKLNKIYGWVPNYYDLKSLPKDMPDDLKTHILKTNPKELNQVWVSCRGEGPADRENIGPITYIPSPGFPGYYFPYENVNGYLSPLIAVHLARPQLNTLINIECRVWTKNTYYLNSLSHRQGSVHFEIMVD